VAMVEFKSVHMENDKTGGGKMIDTYGAIKRDQEKLTEKLNAEISELLMTIQNLHNEIAMLQIELGNEKLHVMHLVIEKDYVCNNAERENIKTISELRDLVKRQEQTIEEMESHEDKTGPFGSERFG
jgi:predicted RNase H-like nuclease (RuvC/YqgF family)